MNKPNARNRWSLLFGWKLQVYVAASSSLIAIFLLAQPSSTFADPDCAGVNQWPTRSALVALKEAGLISGKVDFTKTKTIRLASEQLSQDRYRQIHHVDVIEKSGNKVEIITQNDVSSVECSETGVEVYVISRRLGE
jgi:hypothetical protein